MERGFSSGFHRRVEDEGVHFAQTEPTTSDAAAEGHATGTAPQVYCAAATDELARACTDRGMYCGGGRVCVGCGGKGPGADFEHCTYAI